MPQATANDKKVRTSLLSLIIVHWNTPDLLRECLESIRRSEHDGCVETIVVDCASDRTDVAATTATFDFATLIQMDANEGYAAGCNAGFRASSGEYMLFLNADTTITNRALDTIVNCFQLNPRIGLVAPLLLNRDGSIQSAGYLFPGVMGVVCDLLPVPDRLRDSGYNGRISPGAADLPYAVDYPLGAAVAVRREALEAIGGWDEQYGMYCEEIELARRLAEHGWTRLIEPRARIVHHGGASTGQRPAEMEAVLWRSRGRYYRRWTAPPKLWAIRVIVSLSALLRPRNGRAAVIREAFTLGVSR